MMEEYAQIANGNDEEIRLSKEAVRRINILQPLFCVLCGDLTHPYPSPFGDDTPNKKQRLATFKEVWSQIDPSIPLICTCGNHDIGNTPNAVTIEKYKNTFGDDYFAFWARGCRFIILNSTLIVESKDLQDQYNAQSLWLDQEIQQLKNQNPSHVFIFQHHPLFLQDPNEEDKYYTSDSPINFPKELREIWLSKFKEANVRAVFAGHYHRNDYGKFGEMEMVTTSAVGLSLGKDPSGVRIVKVFKDSIQHEYVAVEGIPENINLF